MTTLRNTNEMNYDLEVLHVVSNVHVKNKNKTMDYVVYANNTIQLQYKTNGVITKVVCIANKKLEVIIHFKKGKKVREEYFNHDTLENIYYKNGVPTKIECRLDFERIRVGYYKNGKIEKSRIYNRKFVDTVNLDNSDYV